MLDDGGEFLAGVIGEVPGSNQVGLRSLRFSWQARLGGANEQGYGEGVLFDGIMQVTRWRSSIRVSS